MDSAYHAWADDPRHRYADTEPSVNALGYELLQSGRTQEALAVFTLNAAAHPRSANAHDSRGEALAMAGDTAAAIREYQAAVRLHPSLPGAADKLRALEARASAAGRGPRHPSASQ
jgi:Flp pilus assembly protein TadD